MIYCSQELVPKFRALVLEGKLKLREQGLPRVTRPRPNAVVVFKWKRCTPDTTMVLKRYQKSLKRASIGENVLVYLCKTSPFFLLVRLISSDTTSRGISDSNRLNRTPSGVL